MASSWKLKTTLRRKKSLGRMLSLNRYLEGVPDDEQAKIAAGNTARVYHFDATRLTVPG